MLTISAHLEPVYPWINPAVLPSQHRDAIRSAAARFPSALSRCIDLECRLGSDQPSSDFLFCVTRREREQLQTPVEFEALPPGLLALPLWQRILRFTKAWSDSSSELYHKVLMVWFEFDLEPGSAGRDALAAPGFFLGSKEFPASAGVLGAEHEWFYKAALPMLAGEPLPAAVEANLRRVSTCLPTGVGIYQIGVFFARQVPHLRACLTGIRPEHLPAYLRKIGYGEDLSDLEDILGALAPLCDVHLDIDVGEQIGPKIGLECAPRRDRLPVMAENSARLLDWLARSGLCSPAQQEALLLYPGVEPFDGPDVSGSTAAALATTQPMLVRELSHIKVVYRPGAPLTAKAYLQVTRARLSGLALAANRLAFTGLREAALHALEQMQPAVANLVED